MLNANSDVLLEAGEDEEFSMELNKHGGSAAPIGDTRADRVIQPGPQDAEWCADRRGLFLNSVR